MSAAQQHILPRPGRGCSLLGAASGPDPARPGPGDLVKSTEIPDCDRCGPDCDRCVEPLVVGDGRAASLAPGVGDIAVGLNPRQQCSPLCLRRVIAKKTQEPPKMSEKHRKLSEHCRAHVCSCRGNHKSLTKQQAGISAQPWVCHALSH